ncbi:uncharacterized protein LOC131881195 [Tigriopus californicus]|uniref:uncharacterized protein LOC131881195 n=1 Tax=Tigriopus californicus TaxID=6832 RepID=UPI0027DA93C1|nr:uncharacterized protein LOC131881195 [Tigriopus californicus]
MVTEGNESLRGDLKEHIPSVSPDMDRLAPMLKGLSSEERDQIIQEENHSSPKAINNQSLDEGILTPIESEDKTSTLADNLAQTAHNNDSFESISLSSAKVPEAKESWSRRTSVISNISESNTSFRGAFALNNLGVMTPDLSVLGPEEQEKILEVIRKDTVLQLYIDLKVR